MSLRQFSFLYILLMALFFSACTAPKTIIIPRKPVPQATPIVTPAAVKPQPVMADTPKILYEKGEYARAEQLAATMLQKESLSPEDLLMVRKYYALSAVANKHQHLAVNILDNWLRAEPGADNYPEWQEAWFLAMKQFSVQDAKARSLEILQSQRPIGLKNKAAAILALKTEPGAELLTVLNEMGRLYSRLTVPEMRQEELILAKALTELDPMALNNFSDQVTVDNGFSYPFTIVRLEEGRRLAISPNTKAEGLELLQQLEAENSLADSGLIAFMLTPPQRPGMQSGSQTALNLSADPNVAVKAKVALLLPMSKNFANIASRVHKGAEIAKVELSRAGFGVEVVLIDTDKPDWEGTFAALPPQIIVGGPMRLDVFNSLKATGRLQNRVLFTFLPQLDLGDEGKIAWRFFTSPQDQVETLLSFCINTLNIKNVAAFYPSGDQYSRRMVEIFSTKAQNQGLKYVGVEYPNNAPQEWNKAAANFLRNKQGTQAVFLPDSWKSAKGILPYIFSHQEDRLIYFGTSLWEQAIGKERNPDAQYFSLALFPGAWNPQAPSLGQETLQQLLSEAGLQGDFWLGLGYDFVRFAVRLQVPETMFTAEFINNQLGYAQSINWSIAPINWYQGIARQNLYLFNPIDVGFQSVDIAAFKEKLAQMKDGHNERWGLDANGQKINPNVNIVNGKQLGTNPAANPETQAGSELNPDEEMVDMPAPPLD